jgi:hypothetical protein|tara:strand:+ start:2658 stop:2801 length:144 start_codon:yes stop_codon:yes gene_type:complete
MRERGKESIPNRIAFIGWHHVLIKDFNQKYNHLPNEHIKFMQRSRRA